ncbi:MAG: hypothetical protein HPY65_18040 [Syntrophaceae bacterium]|nr:hypothetical protein [Syntrophaceae bacterium]
MMQKTKREMPVGKLARRVRELKAELAEEKSRTVDDMVEARNFGGAWYGKPYALQDVMHGERMEELGHLFAEMKKAGMVPRGEDPKKSPDFAFCEQMFAMLEYLIMNAPRVMDSLLALQIRAMKAELSAFQVQGVANAGTDEVSFRGQIV